MDSDSLRLQVVDLNKQVKLLVKTEKRLYEAQRTIERQLKRIELLNRFALESSRATDGGAVLDHAIQLVLAVIRVDQVAAFLVTEPARWIAARHGSAAGFEPLPDAAPKPLHAFELTTTHPVVFAHGHPRDESLLPLLAAAASVFDSPLEPEVAAIEIVMPLRGRVGRPLGTLVLRTIDAVVSMHDTHASEADSSFLDLVRAHVETALQNVFLRDDLAAFVANLEVTVQARTRDLGRLFDHMRQAILAFGPDGRIVGRFSQQASVLFKKDNLEGEAIVQLLFDGTPSFDPERQVFEEWLQASFEVDVEGWPSILALAPTECVIRADTDDERYLTLEFRLLQEDEREDRQLMLLATDVTDQRRLEKEKRGRELEHGQRIAAMRRMAAGGPQLFVQFMEGTEQRLRRIRELIAADETALTVAGVRSAFQDVHTIKGEARAFGLMDLEAESGRLEDALRDATGNLSPQELRQVISSYIEHASESLRQGRALFIEASPIGEAILDQVTVSRTDLRRLQEAVLELDAGVAGAVGAVNSITSQLMARPFGEIIGPLVEAAARWADHYGKQAVVVVEGLETRVTPTLAMPLRAALTHLLRNAIAHGIECGPERESVGKPALGTVRVACQGGGASLELSVEDDGQGIDIELLRKRAAQAGLNEPTQDIELIFEDGLSTTTGIDEIAGRGVGMGAARKELASVGYCIDVSTSRGEWTRFDIRPVASTQPMGHVARKCIQSVPMGTKTTPLLACASQPYYPGGSRR